MEVDHPYPDVATAPHGTHTDERSADGDPTYSGSVPRFRYLVEALPIDPQASLVMLRLAGEIDLVSQAGLETALRCSLQAEPRHLLVDLSAVTFCGARGLGTIGDTARTADRLGIGYAVSGLSPHVRRATATLWEPDKPTRYRSLAMAVTSIRAIAATRGTGEVARGG